MPSDEARKMIEDAVVALEKMAAHRVVGEIIERALGSKGDALLMVTIDGVEMVEELIRSHDKVRAITDDDARVDAAADLYPKAGR